MTKLIDITIPGQKRHYSLKDITIIGRASTTDIKLDDLLVSRHHARIRKSNGMHFIEDLCSQNGVFLNGERIAEPQSLTHGSKVCIGPYILIFEDTEDGGESVQPWGTDGISGEYTQIIMATKDSLSDGSLVDETMYRENGSQEGFEQLRKRLKIFHDVTRAIANIFDIDALLEEIVQIIFNVFPHAERCFVALQETGEDQLTIKTIQAKDTTLAVKENIMSQTLAQRAIRERKSLLIMDTQMDARVSESVKIIGARSILCAPLICPQQTLGILQIESKSKQYEFSKADLDIFTGIASQMALLIYNAELFDNLKKAKERIESENNNLKKQQKIHSSFNDIVGTSLKIKETLELVRKVSDAPCSVLVTGESGSGKELIVKAIHYNSPRSDQPFVAINCAAIPRPLLESELFGYEKGAFTGAVEAKQGLFEVANKGTIFLDEIGDMHIHTQAKLLRVLQEKELQRIGGTKIIKIDVRVLAATNKDLKVAISDGRFREDLFYRLNVVPINIPPLRERREDIPLLVEHFFALSCADIGKHIKGITADVLMLLSNYSWPGNVRELRNVIERIITLAPDDSMIDVDMLPPEIYNKSPVRQKYKSAGTLYEAQRQLEMEMIREALESTGGNKSKAAELLGISRKVLYEKLELYKFP